jgi:predicted O-methyltransferase YrrM
VALCFEADEWQRHQFKRDEPFPTYETPGREDEIVDQALAALKRAGILSHTAYDKTRFLAHRVAVREQFEIPWTAITPRMQRLIYAINAIAQPRVMVAVGIFCGNTFISNAGAAIGPGATYHAERLVGLEINPAEAARARRNVWLIDPARQAEVLAEDGLPWLERFTGTIDLLYLDADGTEGRGKSIYLDLLETGLHALRPGSLVLAHNSVNCARDLADYLAYVRDTANFRASMNMIVDDQGLEVSLR